MLKVSQYSLAGQIRVMIGLTLSALGIYAVAVIACKIVLHYDLPWEGRGLSEFVARKLTKEVYALGIDEDSLLL